VVRIDGSSTVQPMAREAAAAFERRRPGTAVSVDESGTGAGFARFCRAETELAAASRRMSSVERARCVRAGRRPVEVQVANDGVAVAAHADLEVDCLSVGQLRRLLRPGSRVASLATLAPDLPDTPLEIFTPGEGSGTFDFFTTVILDRAGRQRTSGVQTSSDDAQVLTGIATTVGGIGYVNLRAIERSGQDVATVAVDAGNGCVRPSVESVQDGTYAPLARPLFLYAAERDLARGAPVLDLLRSVTAEYEQLADDASAVPMTPEQARQATAELERYARAGTGTRPS